MKRKAGEADHLRRNQVIERPRLTRLLDESTAQIILLIAPAGYGKTILAREWLKERPHNWCRGTPAAADVAALALRLAKAASKIVPGAADRLETRLRISQAPATCIDDLAELLAEDLSAWPTTHWLAFDDYQFACDSERSERFVEHLTANCPIRLLVASRTRPRWATARRTLYGEIFELGRAHLAMNRAEAEAVLRHHPNQATGGLVALADGWPALITLATLARDRQVPDEAIPAELYSFFAEELYRAAEPNLQQALRRLALAPYITQDIAETIISKDREQVIAKGLELGFFISSREQMELHPLLRTFLVSKFSTRQDDPSGRLVADLAALLIAREEWDEVFELASQFADNSLLIDLFRASLTQMLDQARLPTLGRWIATAKARGRDSAIIDLAEAELAFRQAQLDKAEALACRAAIRFGIDDRFASRAHWIAGTSAHLAVNDEAAAEYFCAAEASARGEPDARSAVWGQFLAAEALERAEEAAGLLDRFSRCSGDSIDEHLRIATGRLLMSSLLGGLRETLRAQSKILQLAERSRNPVIASSYLNAYAWLLVMAGEYEDALNTADRQVEIATKHSLGFVLHFALLHTAAAKWGLRNFRSSRLHIVQCEQRTSNSRLLANAGQLLCRLYLADGRSDEALDALERSEEYAKASDSTHAENLAWQSMVYAVVGDRRSARQLAKLASSMSRRLDVSALIPWVAAICASPTPAAKRSADDAFAVTLETWNIDPFVTAYRSYPPILELIAANNNRHEILKGVLQRAHDHTLAETVGIRLPASRDRNDPGNLSKREREVLELVCQGLMNKEIGRALFITEATVKVHVRKICRKLGVRGRTEAAIRAAELSG